MPTALRVLFIEDNEDDVYLLVRRLRTGGYEVLSERVDSPETMESALARQPWDLILSDHSMPHFSAPAALALLQAKALDIPFIIISAEMSQSLAVAAMKAGADDYLRKENLSLFLPAVERELREAASRRARRAAEIALQQSEERYRVLVEMAPNAILLATLEGRLLNVNRQAAGLFGYADPAEMLAADCRLWDYLPPDERLNAQVLFQQLFANGSLRNLELRFRRKDGRIFWTEIGSTLLTDANRRPYAQLNVLQDIGQRKQAEEAVQRLLTEEQLRRRELEILTNLSTALRQAQTRGDIVARLLEHAFQAVAVDAGALLLMEKDRLTVVAAQGGLADRLNQQYAPEDNCLWQTAYRGQPFYAVPDTPSASRCAALCPELAACALIPLKTPETTTGLLWLGHTTPHTFTPDERRLLTALADIAGNALQRAALVTTLEQRVAERTRELTTLYNLSAAASSLQTLSAILDQSLQLTLEALEAHHGTIHLLSETGLALDLAVQRGFAPDQMAPVAAPPATADNLLGRVFQCAEPLLIPDVTALAAPPPFAEAFTFRVYLGVPLRLHGQSLGVLSVYAPAGYAFTVEDVALLATIADQVSIAIDNARLRRQAEQAAVTEERQRLARELHDSVTQMLYSTTLFAETARRVLAAGDTAQAEDHLNRLNQTAQQALKEMRLMIYELRPPALEEAGLIGALQQRLDAVEGHAGVQTRLLLETGDSPAGQLPLPPALEEGLYRIAQEALNNVLKHAAATQVTIRLRVHSGQIELEIADNGRGFEPTAEPSGGMGLRNLRDRASKLGGQLDVLSQPGAGTCIRLNLPPPGAPAPP